MEALPDGRSNPRSVQLERLVRGALCGDVLAKPCLSIGIVLPVVEIRLRSFAEHKGSEAASDTRVAQKSWPAQACLAFGALRLFLCVVMIQPDAYDPSSLIDRCGSFCLALHQLPILFVHLDGSSHHLSITFIL